LIEDLPGGSFLPGFSFLRPLQRCQGVFFVLMVSLVLLEEGAREAPVFAQRRKCMLFVSGLSQISF